MRNDVSKLKMAAVICNTAIVALEVESTLIDEFASR